MSKIFQASFLFLSVLTLGALQTKGQDTIQLQPYVGKLFYVSAVVQDAPVKLLFDAGGGETLLDVALAQKLNKKAYGTESSFRMNGQRIKYQKIDSIKMRIANVDIVHETVGVWDITNVLPKELMKLDGVISLRSFDKKVITVDLSRKHLIFESDSSFAKLLPGLTKLPSRFSTGMNGNELTFHLGIPFNNGRMYWFLFDNGNLNPVLLSSDILNEVNVKGDGISDTNAFYLEFFKSHLPNSLSEDILYNGALNADLIGKFSFTIDLRDRVVYFK
jgi:hypothetical protein